MKREITIFIITAGTLLLLIFGLGCSPPEHDRPQAPNYSTPMNLYDNILRLDLAAIRACTSASQLEEWSMSLGDAIDQTRREAGFVLARAELGVSWSGDPERARLLDARVKRLSVLLSEVNQRLHDANSGARKLVMV